MTQNLTLAFFYAEFAVISVLLIDENSRDITTFPNVNQVNG